MAKLKIELNDAQGIKDILQEAYMLADEQIVQAQNEINKLANATQLSEETIEGKTKYAKAINDYLNMKDKAISRKLDVSKILTEIYKHNGDVAGALDQSHSKSFDFNFDDIKKMVDESFTNKEQIKTIELSKK